MALNIAIIIATEASGEMFEEKGIIHLIAILFVILGVSRIFVHYDAYDRYLRLLIKGAVAALIVFSISHLVEFLGFVVLKNYNDAIFVNVVNFYIMSMLMVALGAEYFLRAAKNKSATTAMGLFAGVVVFFVLTLLIFFKKVSISLEPDSLMVYIYSVIVLAAFFLSLDRLLKIKKSVSIMSGFVGYFIAAFVLVTLAALQYILYDVIQDELGVSFLQIIYISHFLFYGALSLMFLAFARLARLGGMYSEI